jgi:hypothetical protein
MAEERGFRSGWSSSKDNEERKQANSDLAASNSIVSQNRRQRNDDDRSDLERWREADRPVYGQEPIDPSVVKLTQPIKMFGVYVESFSVSVGYGAESSTMQMVLIEDPDNFTQKLNSNGVPLYKGTDSITGREIETTDTLSCDLNGENCTENEKIMIADPIVLQHEVQVLDDDGLPEKNTDGSDKFETVAGFPPVGTVCQFALQGMEFVGVFQRYNYTQGLDGRRYDVTFESPSKILDGVQVILKGFEGTAFQLNPQTYFYPSEGLNFTSQINNVYNPFGIKENFAWGGMFGYSDVNDQGFPVNDKVLDPTDIQDKGLLTLIEEISRSVYTYDNPNGADPNSATNQDDEELIGGPINFGLNKLTIDFGKLKELVPDGYRISGEVTSINAIMQDLTEICLHDYVSSIDPVLVTVPSNQAQAGGSSIVGTGSNIIEKVFKNGVTPTVFDDDGNVVGPVIRFRYQDKSEQPKPGVVAELIENSKKGKTLISANNGKEYADVTTQKLMIGGEATRVWEVGTADLLPALGKDPDGNYLIGGGTGPYDACPIRLPDGSTYVATNLELQMARSGRDNWDLYTQVARAAGKSNRRSPFAGARYLNTARTGIVQSLKAGTSNVASLIAGFNSGAHMDVMEAALLANTPQGVNSYFDAVSAASRNQLGSTYLVPIPVEPGGIDNNLRYKNDFDIEAAWEIAEAAFDPDYRVEDISGYDDEGRLKACAGWTSKSMTFTTGGWEDLRYTRDFSAIETIVPYRIPNNIAQAIGHSNYLVGTTDVKVEKEIIWVSNPFGDPNNPYDDVMAFVHVTVPQVMIFDTMAVNKSLVRERFWLVAAQAFGAPEFINIAKAPFMIDAQIGLSRPGPPPDLPGGDPVVGDNAKGHQNEPPKSYLHPFRITIPQKSNRYSWGPWYKYNQQDGKAEVEKNDQLRPEVFGGNMALLDEAAFALADVSLANLYATEAGTVELAEFPRHNYAERFNENGPYVTSMEVAVGLGGIQTSYQFSTWTRNFGRIAKYNIDRIARINKNKIKKLKGASSGPHFPTKQFSSSTDKQAERLDKAPASIFFQGTLIPSVPAAGAAVNEGTQSTWSMVSTPATDLHQYHGEKTKVYNSEVKNYDIMFGCSMEQLFSPVGIKKNPGEDPLADAYPYIIKHKTPKNIGGEEDTEGTQPGWEGDVRPVAKSLDPYFLPPTTDFSTVYMNDYDWFKNENSMHLENYGYSPKNVASDVRTYGLRGPILLSGWGYDLAGMPVPAENDLMDGQFYPANPALNRGWWKSGPVDLMWDDERQVWAGGLSFVEGKLLTDIKPATDPEDPDTSGTAQIFRRQHNGNEYQWKNNGEVVTITNRDPSLKVSVEEALNNGYDPYVMLIRINYEWRVVYVSCDNFAG